MLEEWTLGPGLPRVQPPTHPLRPSPEQILVRRKFRILEKFLLPEALLAKLLEVLVVQVLHLEKGLGFRDARDVKIWDLRTKTFFATSSIGYLFLRSAYLCSASHSHRWFYFPNSYAVTRNRTHASSVAPLWGTLTQNALPAELPRPRPRQAPELWNTDDLHRSVWNAVVEPMPRDQEVVDSNPAGCCFLHLFLSFLYYPSSIERPRSRLSRGCISTFNVKAIMMDTNYRSCAAL